MLDWTDRHCRFFHRLLTKQAILYTEMVTTGAILHGNPEQSLRFNTQEHPVALQLGGSEPQELAQCARIAQDYGYDEINLNVGCPSERVQKGAFGACLMAEPQRIAECVSAMQAAVTIPVTVKNRLGIDDQDDYTDLHHFINTVSQAGCQTFIIHARKAWLKGLNPKENRDIPPLRYDLVYQIKRDFPALEIIINGGITSLEQCQQHLQYVDGVMVGREAYHNPWLLAQVDPLLYGTPAPLESRQAALLAMLPYIQSQQDEGIPLGHISRHLLGLFHGVPGARSFRRLISENAHKPDAGIQLLRDALAKIT